MTTYKLHVQIGAVNAAISDAKENARILRDGGDEYEAGELLERVEILRDVIKTLETINALKELVQA